MVDRVFICVVLGVTVSASAVAGCKRSPPPMLFRSDAQVTQIENDVFRPDPAEGVDTAAEGNVLLSSPVEGDGSTVTLDNVAVKAAANERFTQYLALDVDADGDRDLVVTRAASDNSARGVGLYLRNGDAFTPTQVEGVSTPSVATCTAVRIRSVSPRSAVLTWECPPPPPVAANTALLRTAPAPGSDMVREHVAVMLAPTPGVRYRVGELRGFPSTTVMTTSLDAVDRDNDGRDDLVVNVSVRRASDNPRQSTSMMVVMFDRATGLARDTSEPDASFTRIVASMRGSVSKRKAPDVLAGIDRLIRLRRAVCSETGIARVKFNNELGTSCGNSAAFRTAIEANARALLALGDLPAASATRVTASANELGVVDSDRFDTELRKAGGTGGTLSVVQGPLNGRPPVSSLRASALILSPTEAPTGVTLQGLIPSTINLLTMTAMSAPMGTAATAKVRSPDGAWELEGFYQTCEGVVASVCPANSDCGARVPAPESMPSRARKITITDMAPTAHLLRCAQNPAATSPLEASDLVRPMGWGQQGLLIAWRGRLMRAATTAREFSVVEPDKGLGSGFTDAHVSAGGRHAVVGDIDGLFVRDAQGVWKLWKNDTLKGRYHNLTDLAVSDDGHTVIGLESSVLWVIRQQLPDAGVLLAPLEPGTIIPSNPVLQQPDVVVPVVEPEDSGPIPIM